MKQSISSELYSEIIDSTDTEGQIAAQESSTLPEAESIRKSSETSEMDGEWQIRHDQLHTMGYRDGLLAGMEAAEQEGFNAGFKASVLSGYNWGLARGMTSATTCLQSELMEKLVDKEETRNEFRRLVQSMSTVDALKLFDEGGGDSSTPVDINHQNPGASSVLESYCVLVQTLVEQCPLIEGSRKAKAKFVRMTE